jgi:hypothetical protein
MDGVMLGIIIFLAIAGPTLLALLVYRRNNPDRRPSADTDPEDIPRPAWWQPWRSIGGTGSGGGSNRGGDSDSR